MAAVLAGCPVEIPDGRFGCSRGEACPPDMVCGAEGLCVRVASGRDAGAIDAGAIDAGGIDASGLDASGIDASGIDASSPDAAADAGPVCRLEVTAVDLYGEAGAEDIAGLHSFGPDNERIALTYTGTLETMAAIAEDALVARREEGSFLRELWISGPAASVVTGMSPDGELVVGATGRAMIGDIALTVNAAAAGFWFDTASGETTLLDTTDRAASVRPNAIARLGDRVCVGGSFRGSFDPAGMTVASDGSDAFVRCWTSSGSYGGAFVLGGSGDQIVWAVASNDASTLYIAGTDDGAAFVARLDLGSGGTELEETLRVAFRAAGGPSSLRAIALAPDAIYVAGEIGPGAVTGATLDVGTDADIVVMRLDRMLGVVWAVTGDDVGRDEAHALVLDRCDRVIVGGAAAAGAAAGPTPMILAYDTSGGAAGRVRASTGTGLFRALTIAATELIAVGPAYSQVSFGARTTPSVQGTSDALIVRLAL
jgi:hypothetical protein